MVPAAGEDGVVTDLASLTLEIACRGDLVTVHVKVDDPSPPQIPASSQTFHLRRSTLDEGRLLRVFEQAVGHAAVRARETPPLQEQRAIDFVARFANLLRRGERDAVPSRGRPAAEPGPAGRERAELV